MRGEKKKLYRSQCMTQSTPCPQQTGTFTAVLASAQALGKEGGDSMSYCFCSCPCLALTRRGSRCSNQAPHPAQTSWMLPVRQGAGRCWKTRGTCTSQPLPLQWQRQSNTKHHFAETQVTPSSSCSLRHQATPHTNLPAASWTTKMWATPSSIFRF